ncbi:phytoene desaturase family protein [Paenibacillus roseipurpureus]|uniref:FAD-dependent oxidoreductase n=1 Tax=Paenibacillus roseopurpureus TaxID=2918901 RepID=A0AA96LQ12_9BACL|nr:FAD-dependent oxidoreductase [Paenibacillus sp. MBLB1832]WNR45044.1 FAD-dependent oxidoreductase [Paenibacillus sp. MBLB1832]
MTTTWDTVVIGGGLAGLIGAIEVAQGGRKVLLLEKSSRLGGRAMTNKKHGVHLNLGGHALYKAGEAYRILRELGIHIEGGAPSSRVKALWHHELMPMPATPASMLTSKLLTWSGKWGLMRLMIKLSSSDINKQGVVTVREWAEREIADPMVRHIFYALCRTATYSHDTDHLLAGPALVQVKRSLKGVLYPHGGWQTIVDQLREKAAKVGVHIRGNASVKEIVHEHGNVQGVRLADNELIQARSVLSTASPSEIHQMVRGAERTQLQQWREEARPSKAACLDIGLRKLPVKDRDIMLALDQPIFFSHHTLNAKLSDDGTLVVHLIKYNGPGESDPKADEDILTAIMRTLHPGWEKEVVTKQFLPNMTVVHDTLHKGRSNLQTGPSVEGILGLYVAGDWVSHGEMLADASAASARRAAVAILTKKQ